MIIHTFFHKIRSLSMIYRVSGSPIFLVIFLSSLIVRADEPTLTTTQAKTITNSIGMKLVLIPEGEFMMGGQETAEELVRSFAAYKRKPDYFKDEYPSHRVRISKPFYLGQYEVTVGNFKQFVKETGYKTEAETDGQGGWGYNAQTGQCEGRKPEFNWLNPGFPQTDAHPVLDVTWNDAVAFCRWLSRKESKTYRLPTEAQWEYACRAHTTTRYYNGDDPDRLIEVANTMDSKDKTTFPHVQELVFMPGEKLQFTIPVGSKKPNPFGLYDMHGNVWEWCSDWHSEDYYQKSPVDDPPGPDASGQRVRRGGAWNSFPLWARASFRNWNTEKSRCVNLGFRVLLAD
jgi:formylglycine-generating enzyme